MQIRSDDLIRKVIRSIFHNCTFYGTEGVVHYSEHIQA
jgi:hypothetical protein